MAVPVTAFDARRQLRMEPLDETRDEDLNSWIAQAAAWVENYTGHILVARPVVTELDGRSPAVLRGWPIKPDAIATVRYVDENDQAVEFIGRLNTTRRPAVVTARPGTSWPFSSVDHHYTVTVQAGYGETDPVPGDFKTAMLVLITAYDEDREGGDLFAKAEATARRLCSSYRLKRL